MKTTKVQQEILLITGTTLTSGELCKNDDTCPNDHLSGKERLEEACWNGLLQTLLPELCMQNADGEKLYLWEIKEGASFLELDLGEAPDTIDRYFSLDPYSFLSSRSYN